MFRGGFDLAEIFAHLRGHPVHPECGVNLFFGGGRRWIRLEPRQGPFAEGVAHFESALAQGDVVGFGAGEVLQRRAVRLGRQQAHVDLEAVAR